MKHRIVFFCGDRSPYGLGHLASIAENFDLCAIVVADAERWQLFREQLSGGKSYLFVNTRLKIIHIIYNIILASCRWLAEKKHQYKLKLFGVPVIITNDVNAPDFIDKIRVFQPEIIISAAYPQIFRTPLLTLAPRGAINFHPSYLPRCRGAHPHYWCLATGEKRGGVSAHFMTERIDDGDIIAQRTFSLDGLYYADLYKKIIQETPYLVEEVKEFFDNPFAVPIPQHHGDATLFRNDREIHHRLDWRLMNADTLYNKIRAGGAFCNFANHRIFIVLAEKEEQNRHMTNGLVVDSGIIVDIDNRGIWVATSDNRFLVISKIRKKRHFYHFKKWAIRASLKIGERFD